MNRLPLLAATLFALSCQIHLPPSAPPPVPPAPGGLPATIVRALEIRAGAVYARVIYAREVKARAGRVGFSTAPTGDFDWDGPEIRTTELRADTIYAREVRADFIDADEIYAREVRIGD